MLSMTFLNIMDVGIFRSALNAVHILIHIYNIYRSYTLHIDAIHTHRCNTYTQTQYTHTDAIHTQTQYTHTQTQYTHTHTSQ